MWLPLTVDGCIYQSVNSRLQCIIKCSIPVCIFLKKKRMSNQARSCSRGQEGLSCRRDMTFLHGRFFISGTINFAVCYEDSLLNFVWKLSYTIPVKPWLINFPSVVNVLALIFLCILRLKLLYYSCSFNISLWIL